ncbi:MAG TPA: glycosyltransferase family 39 protein [Chloroflexota bacterium]|nr:glycosyltransferase family 39 protein [Chloroflexota bacterium]
MGEKRVYAAALTLIAALAVYLRLANLDLAEFKRDEADVALRSLDLLAGRGLPLVGIGTSVPGLENGPLMIYLVAVPLALARDAALASGFVGLLNVAALIASARFAERVFGRVASLLGAFAYAIGSWGVLFSRKLWPNEAMPLFSALLALALHDAVVGGRGRGVVLAGLWLGALVSLHPSGALFVPFALLALALRPSVLFSRWTAFGAGAAGVVALPLLLHEATTHLRGVRAALGASAAGEAPSPGLALDYLSALVGPGAWRAVVDVEPFRARALPDGELGAAMAALLALGVAAAALQAARRLRRGVGWRAPALALMWLGIPSALAAAGSSRMQIHYLIPLVPALFPFVGLALALPLRFYRRAGGALRPAVAAAPALLLLWGLAVQLQHFFLAFDVLRALGGQTPYGVPLRFQRTAVERAVSYAGGRAVVVVSQPGPSGADDLPTIWRFLTPQGVDLRFDDGGGLLRLTPGQRLYVVAPNADPLAAELLAARGAAAGLGVPLPGIDRGYEYWRAAARPARPGAPIAQLENGLRLEEARYPTTLEPREEERVLATWRVERDPPAEELTLFYHLVDDRGRGLGGRDRGGLLAGTLGEGDELLGWARVPRPAELPPGRYWLLVGAYRADVRRLEALGPDRQPLGDAIRLGPLKVPLPASPPSSEPPLARFEEPIVLQACRLDGGPRAGQPFEVELLWRAGGRPSRDLTVFVHLIDQADRIVAQSDHQPDGGYPTGIWDTGEQIVDRHRLAAPAGRYRLRIGLYDPTTLARVRLAGSADDFVSAATVEVRS